MTTFQIIIRERTVSTSYDGDLSAIAREIGRICIEHEEFAVAINLAMAGVKEELAAIRLRDELIGMIKNP